MRCTIIAALLAVFLGLSGCQSGSESIAPPVTPWQLAQLRESYRKNPVARVGEVTAVLPSSNLAAVGSVPVGDFTLGDVITFMDSNGKVLVLGTVEAINANSLTVKYQTPDPKSRGPLVGDVAARFIH
ncbi:MAG: hypothetical protein ABSH08_17460 [Tepidisphaeraceae bacterium]